MEIRELYYSDKYKDIIDFDIIDYVEFKDIEKDNKLYAIKTIKKSKLKDEKYVSHIEAERSILQYIHHPFISSLSYAFQVKRNFM